MEQGVKLKLGLALVLTQLLIYYYVPKGGHKGNAALSEVHGDFCRVSPVEKVCLTPLSALVHLCPQPKVVFAPAIKKSKNDQSSDEEDDGEEEKSKVIGKSQSQKKIKSQAGGENEKEVGQDEGGEMLSAENESQPKEENKETNLSCHIIIVLLVVSVGASLADCFQERARRKANPELMNSMGVRGEPSLNRRMSLADLTMQRHARRESQASFKPPSAGQISKAVADQERFTDRRSSSQESPRGPSALAPSRQKSCPAPFLRRLSTIDLQDARDPQEVSWAERRRVRMIQRH